MIEWRWYDINRSKGYDIEKLPIEVLAKKLKVKMIAYIQLTLFKAIEEIEESTSILIHGLARNIKKVLYKQYIKISVLGCYLIN